MADLYSLVHREAGPLATFTTPAEAEALVDKIGEARRDARDRNPDGAGFQLAGLVERDASSKARTTG